jgi:integrase
MAIGATLKDDRIRGLEVRRHAAGWSWLVYYRAAGVVRRPKIGDYPSLTVAQARDVARKLLARVAGGEDPSQARTVALASPNMRALWERCEREHYDQSKKWGRAAKSIYRRHLQEPLGTLKVNAVTYDDVAPIHVALKKTPNEANRTVAVLSKMLNLAERRRYRPDGSNPCQHVQRYRERKRRPYATPVEIPAIGTCLDKYAGDPKQLTGVAFLLLLIFSGARPSEISNGKPSQLERVVRDGAAYGVLRLKGKTTETTGEDRNVYLPPQAMRVLDRLPPQRARLAGRVTTPRALWDRIREEVGYHDLWIRDFRRMFGTVALSSGEVTLDQLGELFGHASRQTPLILEAERARSD